MPLLKGKLPGDLWISLVTLASFLGTNFAPRTIVTEKMPPVGKNSSNNSIVIFHCNKRKGRKRDLDEQPESISQLVFQHDQRSDCIGI